MKFERILGIGALCLLCACSAPQTRQAGDEVTRGLGEIGDFTQDVADDVEEAFEGGYYTSRPSRREERQHVLWMAEHCHTTPEAISALRKDGLAWSAIAQKYNLRPMPGSAPAWSDWR